MGYIWKVELHQAYGGSEEGDWWYDHEDPVRRLLPFPLPESIAFAICRKLNNRERKIREENPEEYRYGYTSVLSHRDGPYYEWTTKESFKFPEFVRPHYE